MPRSFSAGATTPDEHGGALAGALARVVLRRRIADALVGGAVACAVVAAGTLVGHTALGWGTGVAVATLLFRVRRRGRTAAHAARLVERADPACRNVVVTGEELLRHPDRAAEWIRARVMAEAARSTASGSQAAAVPLRKPAAIFGLALLAIVPLHLLRPAMVAKMRTIAATAPAPAGRAATPLNVVVTVTPPAYTGRAPFERVNPERIEALEGSVVRLVLNDRSAAWRVRYGNRALSLVDRPDEASAEIVLAENGYFAIEPAGGGEAHDRRLIPVAVTPDRAPVLRLERPGRDLLLPDARTTVSVGVSASDDIGLQSLELRYTKVSGTGEQFEFQDGSVPIDVVRVSDVRWHVSGRFVLPSMKLAPGDALVYRAVGRDGRAGDQGLATSDTFFIEIAGPGQVALEGFGMPSDRERYALSQQMIVLKIQRLTARERSLAREAVREATAGIAAEQRAVRSNFIFLMGGHVEDEEQEAEQSSEIAEGRLQSSARPEIAAAVAFMTRAEQGLAAGDTGAALPPAKAAVEALQRAFGRARYLLRTLPVRSRLDPSRRLTGELSAAHDWRREVLPPPVDRQTAEARALLSALFDVAAMANAGQALDPNRLTGLAEQALAIDPADAVWQQVAKRIAAARDLIAGGRPPAGLADAIAPVVDRARRGSRPPPGPGTRAPGSLLSAWAEASRR